jgi:hypothetical protein
MKSIQPFITAEERRDMIAEHFHRQLERVTARIREVVAEGILAERHLKLDGKAGAFDTDGYKPGESGLGLDKGPGDLKSKEEKEEKEEKEGKEGLEGKEAKESKEVSDEKGNGKESSDGKQGSDDMGDRFLRYGDPAKLPVANFQMIALLQTSRVSTLLQPGRAIL